MCGFTGAAWTAESPPLPREALGRMTDVLSHRGPDDAGYYFSPGAARGAAGAALGHRRLSIIDLGGGHQPLANEDETVWIAFNGEIYNYRELQAELEQRGHKFRTASDTETIVHAYEEYGPECVARLRGMFAFAIWDERRKRLFLARDRLGKKPLVYRLEPQRISFGSELKSLLQVPGAPREVDPAAIDDFLTFQYVPHPRSILRGYAKLPPGHYAVFADGGFQVTRYWRAGEAFSSLPLTKGESEGVSSNGTNPVPRDPPLPPLGKGGSKEELRRLLTEAVRLRLRSDVPLGAFLSGGIDSTIIAGLMQQLSSRPVKTFSIGFPVAAYDERSFARQAAEFLKTEHHEQVVEPSALAILPKLIWQYDEPFADSSAIPTMYLSEMTRQHVKVSLSGDGGDELFAGYERYQAVRLSGWTDRLPRFVRKLIAGPLAACIPAPGSQKSRLRRAKRLLSALADPPEKRYLLWISAFDAARRRGFYTPEFRERLGGHDAAEFLLSAYGDCPGRDFVTRTTCADVLTYLPCDILMKVDIASMAYGLECRCPFLDHQVVEFAARLPIEMKLSGRRGKRILRETFADLIPPAIQTRSKMGFGVPLAHWFRHELRPLLQEVLLDDSTLRRGYFRADGVRQLVEQHLQGTWDHSYRLWALLCLELWHRTFVDGDPPTGPAGAV